MLRAELDDLFAQVLEDRHLLTHAFYRRWEAGTLAPGELATYAGQYRHFEAALPSFLEEVARGLEGTAAAELVAANLADERGVPAPHVELFDEFVAAVGGDRHAVAAPATESLVTAYRQLSTADPVAGLAAVAAYELQAPAIARSKADGLYARYTLTGADTRFWEVHADMDVDHSTWALEALAAIDADPAVVADAARTAADAWWSFLDEREAAAV